MHDYVQNRLILVVCHDIMQVIALSTGLAMNWPMREVGRRQETFGHHKLMGIYHFNLFTTIELNYWFDKL